MTIKLHCFGESGHSYKAALALELGPLDWEPVFVDFFNGASRSEEYRGEINAMGEAPVLIDGDVHLTQSGVIRDYLSEKTGHFGGGTPEERREARRRLAHLLVAEIALDRLGAGLHRHPPREGRDALRSPAPAEAVGHAGVLVRIQLVLAGDVAA